MQMSAAVATTVRELRLEKGLSQEKLADKIDSHQVYISEIEQGKKLPSLSVLYRISQTFGLSFSDLIRLVESKLG